MTVESPAERGLEGLDLSAVSDWILGLKPGARALLRFERLGGGQSNFTYCVTDSGERHWVLRRPPLGELLASVHDVVRKYRILAALALTAVPARAYSDSARTSGSRDAPLVLMEHIERVALDGPVAGRLSIAQRHTVGLALPAALGTIHAVDLGGTGLAALASHSSYAERQLRRWHGQWKRSRTRELPDIDVLHGRLSAAVSPQHELTLVHGDFHLGNLLILPAHGSVRAVLDCELCTLDDPRADLGSMLATGRSQVRPPVRDTGLGTIWVSAPISLPSTRSELGRSLEALGVGTRWRSGRWRSSPRASCAAAWTSRAIRQPARRSP